jgi:hypothetical protein
VRLRDRISKELRLRQTRNPRYSLRSYARDLGVHHATLSRLIRGARVETQTVVALGNRLGFTDADLRACLSAEHVAVVSHAINRNDFVPTSRWLSVVTGVQLDQVNIVLQQLLSKGHLQMISTTEWRLASVPQ